MTVVSVETAEGATMQIGDFVCFERIGADREWRNAVGRVLSFPTSYHVRIQVFESADSVSNTIERVDEKLQEIALRAGNESLWKERQELDEQLQETSKEEDKASEKLFRVREKTLQRQSSFSAQTREMMVQLDRSRQALDSVQRHQWRDVRAPGRSTDDGFSIFHAVMVALKEDHANEWGAMQIIIRQPDFIDRIMELDCTVTPLSKARRKKILGDLRLRVREVLPVLSEQQGKTWNGTQLDIALRNWLLTQVACSEAREAEERVVDESFAEHQEQAILVREVNIMREKMAMLREKLAANKKLILGGSSLTALLRDDAAAAAVAAADPAAADAAANSADSFFFKSNTNGCAVKEIISRESVLVVFGAKQEEIDNDGSAYVCLSPEEMEAVQNAVSAAQDVHDVNELEALTAADEREEQEIRELQQHMEELRGKEIFTEEDEEEMRQLDALLTAAVYRHETTQWRTLQLQSMGRDKLFLEKRRCLNDVVYSELQLAFSGDHWSILLDSEEHCRNMKKALANDLSRGLGLPHENFSNICFSLGSLHVKLSVRHGRDVTAEQLQALANGLDFAEFCAYYEMVVSQKTYPINTAQQRAAMERALYEELLKKNITGAGLPACKEDFEVDDDEGATDDEDYRRPQLHIAVVRNECEIGVRYGYPLLAHVAASHEALLAEAMSQ